MTGYSVLITEDNFDQFIALGLTFYNPRQVSELKLRALNKYYSYPDDMFRTFPEYELISIERLQLEHLINPQILDLPF